MKTRKAWIATILALVMLLTSVIPMTAFAGDVEENNVITIGAESEVQNENPAQEGAAVDQEADQNEGEAGGSSVTFIEEDANEEQNNDPVVNENVNNDNDETVNNQDQVNIEEGQVKQDAPAQEQQPVQEQKEPEEPAPQPVQEQKEPEEPAPQPVVEENQNNGGAVAETAKDGDSNEKEGQKIEDPAPQLDPVDPEPAVVIDWDKAFKEKSANTTDKWTNSGDKATVRVKFETGMALDKMEIVIPVVDAYEVKTLDIKAFGNAGEATYTVTKVFDVTYTPEGEDKAVSEKNVHMAYEPTVAAGEAKKVTGIDKAYDKFEGAKENAEATVKYISIDVSKIPAGMTAEFDIVAEIKSEEAKDISIGAESNLWVDGEYKYTRIASAKVAYEEPPVIEEEKPEEEAPAMRGAKSAGDANNGEDTKDGDTRGTDDGNNTRETDPPEVTTGSISAIVVTVEEYKESYEESDYTPASGVKINLYKNQETEPFMTGTTGSDGVVAFNELATDVTYRLSQGSEIEGYTPSEDYDNLSIAEANLRVRVVNQKKEAAPTTCTVSFKAVDADDTDTVIPGVTIEVVDSGSESAKSTTGEDGTCEFEEVSVGTYTFNVTAVPAEYDIPEFTSNEFEVKENALGKTLPLTVPIRKKAEVKVRIDLAATDKDTGEPIQGVKFTVTGSDYSETLTTDAEGKASTGEIAPGTYTIKETSVPETYVATNYEHEITLPTADNENVFETEGKYKKVSQQGEDDPDAKATLSFIVKDGDDAPISGIEFTVVNQEGDFSETASTNESGTAEIQVPVNDTYTASITSSLDAYEEAGYGTDPFEITQAATYEFEVVLHPAEQQPEVTTGTIIINVKDEEGNPIENVKWSIVGSEEGATPIEKASKADGVMTFEEVPFGTYTAKEVFVPEEYVNGAQDKEITLSATVLTATLNAVYKLKTSVPAIKIIVTDDTDDSNPVAGVVFTIYSDEEGTNVVTTITTDDDGIAELMELEDGNYLVKMTTVPEGYKAPETEYKRMYPVEAGVTVKDEIELEKDEETPPVTEKGSILVSVIYTEGDLVTPVAGAAVSVGLANKETGEELETDENGQALFENLEPGEYVVAIDSMPAAYDGEYETKSATVVAGEQASVRFDAVKSEEEPKTGSIKVLVTYTEGDTITPVSGVTVCIGHEEGEIEKESETGENGQAVFEDLEPGEYVVLIDNMPAEYDGEYESKDATVIAGEETAVQFDAVKVPAENGYIQITVTEKGTADTIEGVEFRIVNEELGVDVTGMTDDNGIMNKSVQPGVYNVTISKVPDAYEVPAPEYSKNIEVTSENTTTDALALTRKTTGKISVSVINSETGRPVSDVAFTVTASGEEEGISILTNDEGIAAKELDVGQYTVTLKSIPSGYQEAEYEHVFEVTAGCDETDELELVPSEPVPEELTITEFTGLSFNPEEVTVVPTNEYHMVLDGYTLKFNDATAQADRVRFVIKPVTPDNQLIAKFAGTCEGYKVVTINEEGMTNPIVEEEGTGTVIDFDSKKLPVYDEENNIVDGAEGSLPEDTQFVWIVVEKPSTDFAAEDVQLVGIASETFEGLNVTADTLVWANEKPSPAVTESNIGKLVPGNPDVALTVAESVAEAEVDEEIVYTYSFTNTTTTAYKKSAFTFRVDPAFVPAKLSTGKWTNYNGNVDVIAVNADGTENELCTIDASSMNSVMLTGDSIKEIKFVPQDALAGTEAIEGIELKGSYGAEGTYQAYGLFDGAVTDDIVWSVASDSLSVKINAKPVVTPTPTPTPEVTPTPTPAPENGTLEIMVINPDAEPVADAVFAVSVVQIEDSTDENGERTAIRTLLNKTNMTTGEDGKIKLSLEDGRYNVSLEAVPDKYKLSPVVSVATGTTYENGYTRDFLIEKGTNQSDTIQLEVVPEVTPTPTPEVTPTPSPEPVYPPDGGGDHGGSDPTPTPTPEPDPLTISSPKITSNTNQVAYGDDALFYVNGIAASGMDPTDYYVLHLMIPTGVQVRELKFPSFGADVRISLTYESGTSELGTYGNGDTVTLTDRQGTNLRYIAFQIHGVEKVTPNGEISIMLKNISARDRIVTLQAILSIRDSKTAVRTLPDGNRAQRSDKYNVSISGPKDKNENGEGANGNNGNGNGTNGSDDKGETQEPKVTESGRALPYPLLQKDDEFVRAIKPVEVEKAKKGVRPLIVSPDNEQPVVRTIDTKDLGMFPLKDELAEAHMKLVKNIMLRQLRIKRMTTKLPRGNAAQ